MSKEKGIEYLENTFNAINNQNQFLEDKLLVRGN